MVKSWNLVDSRPLLEALPDAKEVPFIGVSSDRHLLDLNTIRFENSPNQNSTCSFSTEGNIDFKEIDRIGLGINPIDIPHEADFILPYATSWLDNEFMTPTSRHIMWYWWHRRQRDFDCLKSIFEKNNPDYLDDLESYRLDNVGYPFGTYFMRNNLFRKFVSWSSLVLESYLEISPVEENDSWVESLAPGIMLLHLLALFVKHEVRLSAGNTVIARTACSYFEQFENPYLQPAFKGDNVAVVLASDTAYAPLLSTTLESIIENSNRNRNYDIVILDAGLTNADFDFINEQVKNRENFSLRYLHVQNNIKKRNLPTLAHISATTFARFLILDYMIAYPKVVYLDTDLVCTTDIAQLYDTDLSKCLVAAVRDTADAGWSNISDNDTRDYISQTIKLDNVYDYFNAGVLVININAMLEYHDCESLMALSLDKEWRWMDQDVLNYICSGRVKYLEQNWNFMAHRESYFTPESTPEVWLPVWLQSEYREAHDNPKIIHYAGHATPCFSLYSVTAWYFWRYAKNTPYYETLLSMSANDMPKDKLNPITRTRNNARPLVSIIVPVYNSAKYIREALDSLLNQTYERIEIICVNDGSKDNSLDILRDYEKADSRITAIDKKNAGAGAARNTGMKYIHGKYVCFVDSDDFLEDNAIELLVETAEKHHTDTVVFKMDQYDDVSGLYSPNPWAISRSHIPVDKVFYAANIANFYKYLVGFTVNKLYRTDFLLGLNLEFPAIGAHEDMPFTYIALSASKRTFYLDKTLYHYRRSRAGSLSDTTSNHYIYMFNALDCMKTGLIERDLWNDYEQNFVNYVLHMCIWKHSELTKFRRLEFRDSCRTTWFDHFELLTHEKEYYFNQNDYDFIEDTVHLSSIRKLLARCYRTKLQRE